MVMVSSAVLGAATGTGLALVVAVTIVMYRYYLLRRRGKEWDELDRWEETKIMRKVNMNIKARVSIGLFLQRIFSINLGKLVHLLKTTL